MLRRFASNWCAKIVQWQVNTRFTTVFLGGMVLAALREILPTFGRGAGAWQFRISDCLRRLSNAGAPGQALCIETLDYPLEWIEQIIQELDLSICLDIGHLIVNHQDVETAYHRFARRTKMIHLHGVSDNRDHLSLDVLNQKKRDEIFSVLKQFTGTVSIEVFSFNHLLNSLVVLEKI